MYKHTCILKQIYMHMSMYKIHMKIGIFIYTYKHICILIHIHIQNVYICMHIFSTARYQGRTPKSTTLLPSVYRSVMCTQLM